jgi:hypothetical protein
VEKARAPNVIIFFGKTAFMGGRDKPGHDVCDVFIE